MQIIANKHIDFKREDFLWKYMDLHKFFYLIIKQNLFFTRLDKFEDPLEGITLKVLKDMSINDMTPPSVEDLNKAIPLKHRQNIINCRTQRQDYINSESEKLQKTQYANCWFVNRKESFAMWNLYSNSEGIAIRYNPSKLINIVRVSAETFIHPDFKTFIYGFVDYLNLWPYNHYPKGNINIKFNAFKKDDSYIHEKEFRFVVATLEECEGKYDYFELPIGNFINDDFLIYANPYMDEWKVENLRELLKKYSLDHKLLKSRLKV